MSNDTELFELCKGVHKRTGWGDDDLTMPIEPLYTSDYLLEKLPSSLNDEEGDAYRLTVRKVGDDWLANYVYDNVGMWHRFADTPLKALLKLTIALSDAGELK